MIEIQFKTLHAGQVRPYADTVYDYEITAPVNATDQEVWDACQAHPKISNAPHRKDGYRHDGSCGFPFGLNSFGSLSQSGAAGNWRYTVTQPYCD